MALAATLVVGVFTAAPAFAVLPEFRPLPGSGGTHFSGSFNSSFFEEANHQSWEYSHGTISGVIAQETGENVGKILKEVTIKFTGGPKGCNNGASGELIWSGLEGRLGYINEEKHEAGIALYPSGLKTFSWTKCTGPFGAEQEFEGLIVVPITPNTSTTVHHLSFQQSGGQQHAYELKHLGMFTFFRLINFSGLTPETVKIGVKGEMALETSGAISIEL
ncbi:MAG TPA: hypothetical protein VK781_13260 [Solirubrobacteraceae bacterium]|nr:hypothetical protein [Solirubrobacteraceae bacterium]